MLLSLFGFSANPVAANGTPGWDTAAPIEDDTGSAFQPDIAMDINGNAIAVWTQWDGSLNSIWANRYEIGIGWGIPELIENNNSGDAMSPQVTMNSDGSAIVVFEQYEGWIRSDICANRYEVGTGWGTAEPIETNTSVSAYAPRVAMDSNGNAIAVWQQWDGIRENISANRYEVGTGWGNATYIATNNLFGAYNAQVAMDGNGNAIAVWQQSDGIRNNIWANRYEIGTGWGTSELIQSNPSEWADSPRVAMDSIGNAFTVWPQWFGWVRSDIWANHYNVPPFLSIVSPTSGETTEIPVITVSGKTEPGVELIVNGIFVAVESDGTFSFELALKEGSNAINAEATDYAGLSTSDSVTVTFNNPVPGLDDELSDTQDELNVTRNELNATQSELNDALNELDATRNELDVTSNDVDNLQSQSLILMVILAVFAILAAVMAVMYMNLRKKIGELSPRRTEQEPPPPPPK